MIPGNRPGSLVNMMLFDIYKKELSESSPTQPAAIAFGGPSHSRSDTAQFRC